MLRRAHRARIQARSGFEVRRGEDLCAAGDFDAGAFAERVVFSFPCRLRRRNDTRSTISAPRGGALAAVSVADRAPVSPAPTRASDPFKKIVRVCVSILFCAPGRVRRYRHMYQAERDGTLPTVGVAYGQMFRSDGSTRSTAPRGPQW